MLQLFIHTLYLFTAKKQLNFNELSNKLGVPALENVLKTNKADLTIAQLEQWLFWLQQHLGNPHIGLQVGRFSDFSQVGAIGHLMQTCQTIREATILAIQWMEMSNPYFRVEVEEDAKEVAMVYLPEPTLTKEYPKMAEEALQMFVSSAYLNNNKLVMEERIPLTRLTFTCQPPADITYFEKIFGVRPEFGAARNTLSFAREWYDRPIISYNKELFDLLNKHFEAQVEAAKNQENQRLSLKIKSDIMTAFRALSDVTIDDIAEMHGLSIRAVQRVLKADSTSFRQLREKAREELAATLLQDKSVQIKEISYLLNYNNISAFSKAFRRWKGMSPTEYQASGQ